MAVRSLRSTSERQHFWRCTTCGKWSMAKKMPRKHQRWLPETPAFTNLRLGQNRFVDCGPFEAWIAMPEAEWNQRHEAVLDARDYLAEGNGEGAWKALTRHEQVVRTQDG
jgi:hypothetical protein